MHFVACHEREDGMKVDYRSIFIAPQGKLLVSLDLSQAESWVVAFSANERNMKYALMYSDIHCQGGGAIFAITGCFHDWIKETRTCKKCGVILTKDQRYLAKRRNHASSYGMSPAKGMEVINGDSDKPPYISISLAESEEHHNAWHAFYNVRDWWAEIKACDRTIVNTYGRSRTFYGQWVDSPIDKPSELEREKIANLPQGTVADHFNGAIHPIIQKKGGLIEIFKQLIKPYWCGQIFCSHSNCHKIINQAHDSCILELPSKNAKDVGLHASELLLRPMVIKDEEFTIPVDGKIGERWQEDEMEKLVA